MKVRKKKIKKHVLWILKILIPLKKLLDRNIEYIYDALKKGQVKESIIEQIKPLFEEFNKAYYELVKATAAILILPAYYESKDFEKVKYSLIKEYKEAFLNANMKLLSILKALKLNEEILKNVLDLETYRYLEPLLKSVEDDKIDFDTLIETNYINSLLNYLGIGVGEIYENYNKNMKSIANEIKEFMIENKFSKAVEGLGQISAEELALLGFNIMFSMQSKKR